MCAVFYCRMSLHLSQETVMKISNHCRPALDSLYRIMRILEAEEEDLVSPPGLFVWAAEGPRSRPEDLIEAAAEEVCQIIVRGSRPKEN